MMKWSSELGGGVDQTPGHSLLYPLKVEPKQLSFNWVGLRVQTWMQRQRTRFQAHPRSW